MKLSTFLNLKKIDLFLRNAIKPPTNILVRIKNRIYYHLLIREFFQSIFDKIYPYKKYYIDKKYIPLDIDKLVKEYTEIDEV